MAIVERLKRELPDFEQVGEEYRELQKLESIAQSLESKSELTRLRAEDLRERTRSREPRVEALTAKIRILGTPALVELAARRELLPVRETPPAGELSATCGRFYEILLAKELDKLSTEGRLRGDGSEEGDYGRGILWALEVERKGKDAAESAVRLKKHIASVMRDLDSSESLIRDRARLELYRLGERGLAALVETRAGETVLKKKTHSFLHDLLRWRISPEVYSQVGIQFTDYASLPFAARRRKIFQYARAAGGKAIPTLRAIVSTDALEPSFLVKYAAARALMTQLSDRWGFLFLQASNPELVLKRPEISRDLLLLQGLSFVRSREYQSAAREFRKIIEEFPFDFEGHYHLGFSYLLLKNYTQAIYHFEVARRINPKDELTLYNLACACSLAGRLEKALEALDASVEAGFKDPDHLENDSDLDPLRDLDGYKRILEKCRAED
jgi:tetratricopeptide (TPR) repeat protein